MSATFTIMAFRRLSLSYITHRSNIILCYYHITLSMFYYSVRGIHMRSRPRGQTVVFTAVEATFTRICWFFYISIYIFSLSYMYASIFIFIFLRRSWKTLAKPALDKWRGDEWGKGCWRDRCISHYPRARSHQQIYT